MEFNIINWCDSLSFPWIRVELYLHPVWPLSSDNVNSKIFCHSKYISTRNVWVARKNKA